MSDPRLLNGVALAFEGDAVYDVYIRHHLISQGLTKPSRLHQIATRFVSAKAQASLVAQLLREKRLTQEEERIYKRGRNAPTHTKAKNTDIITYKMATGFEAVIGYLYLTHHMKRLEEMVDWCIRTIERNEKLSRNEREDDNESHD